MAERGLDFDDAPEVFAGPVAISTGVLVSIRLDQEVLDRLRELGPGWQTKANAALRAFVDSLPKNDDQGAK